MTAHPLRALPLILALLLLSCTGGIRYGGNGGGTSITSITGIGGARVAAISYGELTGTRAVALPSGDMILCRQWTPLEYRMERLSPTLDPIWSAPFPVPESHRTVGGASSDWAIPADGGLLLRRAGAAVALLCARRTGPDSIATVARLFDTASGRLLRDTVLMRQRIDGSIPEITRGVHAIVSPNGSRIATYARLHAYGVEATELAVQLLDRYLNPIETRKIRCAVADDDQLGLLQLADDGTLYILSKNRGDSIEILRLSPGAGTPARRTAAFRSTDSSGLHLRSYAMALGAEGIPMVTAMVVDGDRLAGIVCGSVDFGSERSTRLRYTPLHADAEGVPADPRILAFLPIPRGGITILARSTSQVWKSPGDTVADVIAVAVEASGERRWLRTFGYHAADVTGSILPSIDAQVDDIGTLRFISLHTDTLELRIYRLDDGHPLLQPESRTLAVFPRGRDSHFEVAAGSIAWLDSHTAALAIDLWARGGFNRYLSRIQF